MIKAVKLKFSADGDVVGDMVFIPIWLIWEMTSKANLEPETNRLGLSISGFDMF